MKIIKHGRDPSKSDPIRVTDLNCGTVFEFTSDEATVRPDPRDGDYYEVKCPVCGRLVTKAIDKRMWG